MNQEIIGIILEDVLLFHQQMEKTFIMDKGIHNMGLLESAVNNPFQTFDGQDLYPTTVEKAARLCYGIIKNHPFCDGNKRSAVHSMLVFLYINGIDICYTQIELEDMVVAVADSHMPYENLVIWIQERIKQV